MPLVTTPYGDQVLLPDEYSQPVDPTALPGAVTPGTPMPSGPDDPGYQPPQSVAGMIAPSQAGPFGAPAGAGPAPLQVGQTSAAPPPPDAPQPVLPPGVSPGPSSPPAPTVAGAIDKINGVAPPKPAAAPAVPGLPSLEQTTAMGVGAIRDQQQANADATDAQAKAADAQNEARKVGYAEADRLAQQQQAQQAERMKARATIDAHLQQMQKEADDYKIDPHGGVGLGERMGSLVGAALSGVGLAMMGKGDAPNPVIGMIEQHIKDGVARQMDQRAQLQKRADRGVDQLDRFDHFSSDLNAQSAAMQAQALQRTARQVELAAGQYASADIRANGKKAAADLNAKAAELYAQAGNTAFDRSDKEYQRKIAQQNANTSASSVYLADKRAKDEAIEKKREFDAGLTEREADRAERAREKDEATGAKLGGSLSADDKAVGELGIRDPATGDYLAKPEQQQLKTQSQSLRTAAAATQDPIKKQTLLANADAYDHAAQNAVLRVGQKEQQAKTQDVINNAQNVTDAVSELNRALSGDPSVWDRETRQRMESAYAHLKNTLGKTEGARLNEQSQEILENVLGPNPGDITSLVKDKGKIKAALDTYKNTVVNEAKNHLRGAVGKTDWQPREVAVSEKGLAPIDEVQLDQTPLEQADGQNGGIVRRSVEGVPLPRNQAISAARGILQGGNGNPSSARTASEIASAEAENQGTGTGLSDQQQLQVDGMIARARKAGPASPDYQMLIAAATDANRPSLAAGVVSSLRGNAPEIYDDVLKQLPPEQQQNAQSADTLASHFTPAQPLIQSALNGDLRASEELTRRAVAGDPEALRGTQLLAALRHAR